jgi:hypothetical protein
MLKTVTTYDELAKWVSAYRQNVLDLMIIEGSPGVGKSSLLRSVMREKYLLIEGRISAVMLYEMLSESRDLPIIIDDVDDLYRDKAAVNLLKCLCQTTEDKRVVWNTYTTNRGQSRPEFTTKSKVCILTNRWETLNKHVGAIEDRGILIKFRPTPIEVHDYIIKAKVDVDPDVYDYIGDHLGLIADPSIRHYRNASKLKTVDMDWKLTLSETFGLSDSARVALRLCQDSAHSSNDQRAKIFESTTGKSARTFYRHLADFREKGVKC